MENCALRSNIKQSIVTSNITKALSELFLNLCYPLASFLFEKYYDDCQGTILALTKRYTVPLSGWYNQNRGCKIYSFPPLLCTALHYCYSVVLTFHDKGECPLNQTLGRHTVQIVPFSLLTVRFCTLYIV